MSAGPGLLTPLKAHSQGLLCSCSKLWGAPCFQVCLFHHRSASPGAHLVAPSYAKVPVLRAARYLVHLPALLQTRCTSLERTGTVTGHKAVVWLPYARLPFLMDAFWASAPISAGNAVTSVTAGLA